MLAKVTAFGFAAYQANDIATRMEQLGLAQNTEHNSGKRLQVKGDYVDVFSVVEFVDSILLLQRQLNCKTEVRFVP